jgi:TolB protein
MKGLRPLLPLLVVSLAGFSAGPVVAQDWVHTGTNLGNQTIRIAAADFKPLGYDAQTPALKAVFDATLYNDLGNAGIFDVVSKSLAPQAMPGSVVALRSQVGSLIPATLSIPRSSESSTTRLPRTTWRAP